MTRKEFIEETKRGKEKEYKSFLQEYEEEGTKVKGRKEKPEYFVFRDEDPEAWNKILDNYPRLWRGRAKKERDHEPCFSFPLLNDEGERLYDLWKEGKITADEYDRQAADAVVLKDPKKYFDEIYYEPPGDPSEGFLSSEEEKKDEEDKHAYGSDNSNDKYTQMQKIVRREECIAEGIPYCDLEEVEEIVEKMPAPAPAPAPAPVPPVKESRHTTYDKPEEETLPEGWAEALDDEGHTYYYNSRSRGESTYERPR